VTVMANRYKTGSASNMRIVKPLSEFHLMFSVRPCEVLAIDRQYGCCKSLRVDLGMRLGQVEATSRLLSRRRKHNKGGSAREIRCGSILSPKSDQISIIRKWDMRLVGM